MSSGVIGRYRLALTLAGFTWPLLVVGANVTSTGSGLAVPDWPLAFGQWLPEMAGKVLYEHGHRLFAMVVGALTLALALWVGISDRRAGARWLAIAALGAVIAQGLLGRATVLYQLPPLVSIAHAGLAEAFFCLTLALVWVLRPESVLETAGRGKRSPFFGLCVASTLVVYGQVLLGAMIRHTGSGLWYHVAGVVAVFLVVYCTGKKVLEEADPADPLRPLAILAMVFFGVQLALGMGAAVYLGTFDPHKGTSDVFRVWVRNLHLGVGALLLGTCFWMTLRAIRLQSASTPT